MRKDSQPHQATALTITIIFNRATIAVMALEVVLCLGFAAVKWAKGLFWLLRVTENKLIVPNSAMSFAVLTIPYFGLAIAT